jgi:predicted RNA-binding protein with PIN domain
VKGATATALLRPALEAAVDVARAGERAAPPTPAPGPLRRYLNFARLPDPALEVARRVLDDDEAFRSRVADATAEDIVGRPGWLYLQRPDGWQAELDRLLQEAAAAEMAAKDERHERGAQRRLAGAEAALARAESTARASASEALTAQHALQAERDASAALADQVEQLGAELDHLRSERAELIRRLKGAETTANQRSSELRAARHELRMVQAELGQVTTGAAGEEGGVVLVPASVVPPADAEAVESAPGPDPAVVGDAVAAVVLAADELRAALGAIAGATAAGDVLARHLAHLGGLVGIEVDEDEGEGGGGETSAPAAARPVAPRSRRRPVGPPPGVYDDAPEAAEHLVRVPGVLVLVDGYNISHAQWHGMAPAEQRTRLLGACGELHARCGTDVEVVFDGAGEAPGYGGSSRDGVRHQFTPAGVEADDVILERIGAEPIERPVVVVSSDRRVRDGARQRGADVLGARQFLGVLRRAAP